MKVVLTSRSEVTSSKTNQKFVIYNGISESGEVITALISPEQDTQFGEIFKHVISKEELAEIFESYKPVNVDFNQRGRLVSITTE